jgi:hypothetical protein
VDYFAGQSSSWSAGKKPIQNAFNHDSRLMVLAQ